MYTLWTDGACKSNPGCGGWAWLLVYSCNDAEVWRQDSGSEPQVTNNQMELKAVIEGLKVLPVLSAVTVVTDSTYVITVANSTKHHAQLKNSEMVYQLRQLIKGHQVQFEHVKGHSGVRENELVDKLASDAAKRQIRSIVASS